MLYKKPRSKFTCESISSLVSQCAVTMYAGMCLSAVVLNGEMQFKLFVSAGQESGADID